MAQVQVRLPEKIVEELDRWIAEKRFKSRSDAIRSILGFYEEREKTQRFLKMMLARSSEAKKHPEILISLEEIE